MDEKKEGTTMTTAIAVKEPQELTPATLTPLGILQMAVERGANPEALTKLMELQERWERNEARKAFEEAFAAFKAEAPRLDKTKEVSFGANRTTYRYTPLDHIANTLGPILANHSLSYNWRQDSLEGTISVTCVLRHAQGHSIENTLSAEADSSGSKNSIQAIGSAVSYLRRYTLLGVLGMATSDEDTDGTVMDNVTDFLANIEASSDMDELSRTFKEAITSALKAQDSKAVKKFMDAKDKRRNELSGRGK